MENKKEKKPNRFIQSIKKKWLINGTRTLILILIILAVFVGINILMQKLELTPIDLSQEKLYTLTEESKEKVKDIEKDINIYFVGYQDGDSTLELAKQYNKANEKIKVEAVTVESRPDLAEKYGFENGSTGIIVECGEKYKVLTYQDLVTYDQSTYETIDIAEERKAGTEQLLLTSPLSITKIVLGKFIAAMIIVVITSVFTLMYFAILCHFGMPHISTAITAIIGFILFVMTYIAFGMLASSITENQIIAGIISIAFFVITWVMPNFNYNLEGLSFINMLYKYTSGQIDIADTVTFVTFTIMCILLTIIVLQRRKSAK